MSHVIEIRCEGGPTHDDPKPVTRFEGDGVGWMELPRVRKGNRVYPATHRLTPGDDGRERRIRLHGPVARSRFSYQLECPECGRSVKMREETLWPILDKLDQHFQDSISLQALAARVK